MFFFFKVKQWKQIVKLSQLDNDLLTLLFSYLEAKQDLNSVCLAIDLYVSNRIYKRAIELYEKYSNKIINSEYEYLSSMIEIAKEMYDGYSSSTDELRIASKCYNIINANDLRSTRSFQYIFKVPFKDLCKSSKRCLRLLDATNDIDYLNILKLPEIESFASNIKAPLNNLSNNYNNLSENMGNIAESMTPYNLSKTLALSSLKKHISTTSTPQSVIVNKVLTKVLPTPISKQLQTNCDSQSRVLTSSLKLTKNATSSVTKSVKFQLKKYTREISNENKEYNEYEDEIANLTDENNLEKNDDDAAVERKQLFSEEIEESSAPKNRISNVYKSVNFGSNYDLSSDDETSNQTKL